MNVTLKALVAKLNDTCRAALEGAAGLCLTRTHYDVDVEHFLVKLCEAPNADTTRIIKHYGVDPGKLAAGLNRALDRLKTGNARTPTLAPRIPRWLSEAWTLASVELGASSLRSGHLLLALLSEPDLARLAAESSPELAKISVEDLTKRFGELTAGSAEDAYQAPSVVDGAPAGTAGGKTPALDQYTVDLTARARQGEIDPVLGRDFEVRQLVDILTAPAAEQSDPHRRGRRRQDRGGRGLRAAHRGRRRAAPAAQGRAAHARPGAPAGRRRRARASSRTG